ncbi:hypothetical protein TSUD_112380 [Trifolium subterraneum]|uniref:Reverse transcriptase domain-containing protein n=1 Tax=Trifolium subterraneum TaxID=3900 RepID=A0A2Z6M0P4_TRISU|nr:hypothetical protein TSUD_112380 [Trifolium subterraneum]
MAITITGGRLAGLHRLQSFITGGLGHMPGRQKQGEWTWVSHRRRKATGPDRNRQDDHRFFNGFKDMFSSRHQDWEWRVKEVPRYSSSQRRYHGARSRSVERSRSRTRRFDSSVHGAGSQEIVDDKHNYQAAGKDNGLVLFSQTTSVVFYITNFPENLLFVDLKRGLEVCGIMEDVYVSRHRNSHGQRFGFVKYQKVRDVMKLKKTLNSVYFWDLRLFANVAKFDRFEGQERENGEGGFRGIELEKVKDDAVRSEEERERERAVIVGEVERPEEKEPRAKVGDSEGLESGKGAVVVEDVVVVTIEVKTMVPAWKYLSLKEDVSWASKCRVARLKQGWCFSVVQQSMLDAGLEGFRLIALGGDNILIHQDSDGLAENLFQEAAEIMNNFLEDCRPWELGDARIYERGAWLRCYGVPIQAWNPIFFCELAESQGRLLKIDDCTYNKEQMDYARILVATTSLQEINTSISVVIDNINTHIRVVEDLEFGFAVDACLVENDEDNRSQFSGHFGSPVEDKLVDTLVQQLHGAWISKSEAGIPGGDEVKLKAANISSVGPSLHPVVENSSFIFGGKKCLDRSLKKSQRRTAASKSASSQHPQGTSLSAKFGNSGKASNSNDWKNWAALHGDERQVQDDVHELGDSIGVDCHNNFQMKIVSFNIRGLGAVEKRRELRRLVLEKKVDILCIQETKLEVVEDSLVRFIWGSDDVDFSFKPSVGAPGGLVTMWNTKLVDRATSRLEELDTCKEGRGLDEVEEAELLSLPVDIMALSKLQANMYCQKSRVTWLWEGDANSKFFHGVMSSRRRANSIGNLIHEGRTVDIVPEVRHIVYQHFSNHFRKQLHHRPDISRLEFRSLSSLHGADLTKPFLLEEIKAAVWDCDSFKCPGPDGINIGFFKDFWDLLKVDLLNFFSDFHRHGVLTKGLNSTFIALIPKVESPLKVSDFRPIALVSTFIKGRQILDGILIANELVDDAKRNAKDLLLFKVDFEKAYDSMDWDYLNEVMVKMNFPSQLMGWMKACVMTASASVLVNGSPTDEFPFERGLRQGDPLSPFLFLLAAEGLNVLMSAMVRNGSFIPYRVGSNISVSVSHLQFADDTLLVGVKSWANVRALKSVLILFENISGLKVNFHKSMLFGVNVNSSWLHEAASVMHCKHGCLPFLYLGLPIGGDSRRLQFWKPLLDKIHKRLTGWKCKNLSFGGRLVLLKYVLSSVPIYFLSFFKAPSGIISTLESIFCHFFWGGSGANNKISWVKWESICSPRENGGLGVRRVKDFNYALLGKWVWRCLAEGDSLWCRLLKVKYGQDRAGRVMFSDGVGSSWWRALNKVRSGHGLIDPRWLADNIVRQIGDGRTTSFWVDSWLEVGPLARAFSRLYDLADNKNISVADMCANGWALNGNGRKWRRRLFAWEEELVACVGVLANFVLQGDVSDRWVWKLHPSQSYSVRSAYSYLTLSDGSPVEDVASFLWVKSVPLKVNIFIWRLFLNRLPTKDNLLRQGVIEVHQVLCATNCGNPKM